MMLKQSISFKQAFLFLSLLVFLGSCAKDPDDIFDESAILRADAHREACYDALVSAENGWIMNYYPESENFGGYTFYMIFQDDGRVIIRSEEAYLDESDTATFKVHSGQSTVLSLDTYSVFHTLSDPEITEIVDGYELYVDYGAGYQGDFEFTCEEISDEKMVFTSLKRQTKVVFTKVASAEDADAYLTSQYALHTVLENQAEEGFFMKYGSDSIEVTYDKFHYFNTYTTNSIGEYATTATPFCVTDNGIVLYNSVSVGGVEVDTFTWDASDSLFRSAEGVELVTGGSPRAAFANPSSYKIYYVNFDKSGSAFLEAVDSLEARMKSLVDNPQYFAGVTDIRFIMNGYTAAQEYYGGSHRIDVYSEVDLETKNNLYLIGTTAKSLNELAFNYALDFGDGNGGTAGYSLFHSLINDWLYSELYGDNVYTVVEESSWSLGEEIKYFKLIRNDNPDYYISLDLDE